MVRDVDRQEFSRCRKCGCDFVTILTDDDAVNRAIHANHNATEAFHRSLCDGQLWRGCETVPK